MKKIMLLAAAVASLTYATTANANPYNLTLCAASVGGTWSLIGSGIDAAMKRSFPGSVVTILTSQGGIANAASLQRGGCDLGIMHAPELAMALAGQEPFTTPIENLRMVARIENWSPMHIMVSQNFANQHNLETVADIATARAPFRVVLQRPGNIGYQVARDILLASGISQADLESWGGSVLHGASAEQANLIRDRRADGGMNILFPGAAQVLDVAQAVPIKLLSIPDEIADEVSAKWNVPRFVIPAGTYDFAEEDVLTVTLGAHLIALESLPDETVEAVLTAITDNADAIASVHPSMRRLDIDQYSGASLPYHDAAARFYEERDMMPAE